MFISNINGLILLLFKRIKMSPGLGKWLKAFLVEIFLTEERVIFIMLESCYVTGPKFFQ